MVGFTANPVQCYFSLILLDGVQQSSNPGKVMSYSNPVSVQFTSDSSNTYSGVLFEYKTGAFLIVMCHGSMINEVLFQAGNHSFSCGISGRNQGSPLHHFSQGFPHFENEVPAYSIVYLH